MYDLYSFHYYGKSSLKKVWILTKIVSEFNFITTFTFSICISLYLGYSDRFSKKKSMLGILARRRPSDRTFCLVLVVTQKSEDQQRDKYSWVSPSPPSFLHKL